MKLSFLYTILLAIVAISGVAGRGGRKLNSKSGGDDCCDVCDPAETSFSGSEGPNKDAILAEVQSLLDNDSEIQALQGSQMDSEIVAEFGKIIDLIGEIGCDVIARFAPLWTYFPDIFCAISFKLFAKFCTCGSSSKGDGRRTLAMEM